MKYLLLIGLFVGCTAAANTWPSIDDFFDFQAGFWCCVWAQYYGFCNIPKAKGEAI